MTAAACTCGPGVWATCDQCGADAWCAHHCGFPCDDVTCEDGTVCWGCLGRPCPVHNDDDGDDEEDWEETVGGWKAEIQAMPTADLLASFGEGRDRG